MARHCKAFFSSEWCSWCCQFNSDNSEISENPWGKFCNSVGLAGVAVLPRLPNSYLLLTHGESDAHVWEAALDFSPYWPDKQQLQTELCKELLLPVLSFASRTISPNHSAVWLVSISQPERRGRKLCAWNLAVFKISFPVLIFCSGKSDCRASLAPLLILSSHRV